MIYFKMNHNQLLSLRITADTAENVEMVPVTLFADNVTAGKRGGGTADTCTARTISQPQIHYVL